MLQSRCYYLMLVYRVKSKRGVQFRIWATNLIKEYMKKGFVLDDERLKELGGGGYFKELLRKNPRYSRI
ncbi:MAG: RhuM family protein [Thomasclavelia sp.]